MAGHGFEQLETWRQAMELTMRLFKLTDHFPAEERSGLTATLRRTASALAAKIAEVTAYDSADKLLDAYVAALGTLREIQTHLLIAQRLHFPRAFLLWKVRRAIGRFSRTLDREIDVLRHRRQVLSIAEASACGNSDQSAGNATPLRQAA